MNLTNLTPDLKLKLLSMLSALNDESKNTSSTSGSNNDTSNNCSKVTRKSNPIIKKDKLFILDLINSIQENGFFVKDSFQNEELTTNTKDQLLNMKNELNQAGIGEGSAKYVNTELRGDLFKWLSLSDVPDNTPLKETLEKLNNFRHVLNYLFDLDLDRNSIQVAFYTNGARYIRHADASPLQSSDRRLTFLLYFNKEINGGSLKLYRKERSFDNDIRKPYNYQFKENSENETCVQPIFNRLLSFSSEYYHEVLPSLSDRFSLTMWMYGKKDVWRQINDLTQSTIFISICSYRDSELQHTINDMFKKAYYPNRLRVGICLQVEENDSINDVFDYRNQSYSNQIKEILLNYKQSQGPCFARYLIQQRLYNQEDYYLQIDSHMRFDEGWDLTLIKQLKQVDDGSKHSILSTYPVGYELPNQIPEHAKPTVIVAKTFSKDENGFEMVRLGAKVVLENHVEKPIPSLFYAAGFAFSFGKIVQDCPYEELPFIFFGEEMFMLNKFICKGYKLYSPTEPIIYHLWKRSYRKVFWELSEKESSKPKETFENWTSFVEDFEKSTQTQLIPIDENLKKEHNPQQISEIRQSSQEYVSNYIGMTINTTIFDSSGNEFSEYCGIDFKNRSIGEKALNGVQDVNITLV